jgi:hypothetical protein
VEELAKLVIVMSFLVTETHHDLVKEVLDELFLQRSGSEQPVKVGAQQLRDEVTMREGQYMLPILRGTISYMSSNGEMKMSLREMTCAETR